MQRPSTNLLNSRRTPLTINDLGSGRTSRQSPRRDHHQSDDDDDNDDEENQTIRKFLRSQPINPSRSRSPSTISLKSMIIDGQWKYRKQDNDDLRLEAVGIKNLVEITHEILRETLNPTNNQKKDKRSKSLSVSANTFPLLKLDQYEKITPQERATLKSARVFNLMTIVYQAAATDASISQLVRIWREADEHIRNPRQKKKRTTTIENRPTISYKHAFEQMIRQPNDQLFQIALHASLIQKKDPINLRRLGKELGIDRDQFDMETIRQSSEDFRDLIQFLCEQRKQQKQIDYKRLKLKSKKKQGLHANVSGTKFRLICQAVDTAGFTISPDSDFTSNLLWNDTLISMDIVSALKPYQKVNHFPTMNEISRKDLLAKNYDRLSYALPKEYNFAPKTWVLPADYNLWYSFASNQPKTDPMTYILKPTNSAMSQGIALHCDYKQIPKLDNYIIQEYIREPYLIDGYKFDLRIYALITSCDPLRVFIFKQGLIRICSKKYHIPTAKNLNNLSIHLTNYRIDEEKNFDFDENKRTLKFLLKYLKEQHQDERKLWNEIQNIVLKTIFLAEPHLFTAYRTCRPGALPSSESVCFELLGFDILIDKNLKPWIIEVNRCPNFDVEDQIEFDIKMKFLYDTFDLLGFHPSDRKKSIELEKFESQQRLLTNLGRTLKTSNDELKDKLYLIHRERKTELYENDHLGELIRLFPMGDERLMNESFTILTRCFQILSIHPNDSSWNSKYTFLFNEKDLLSQLTADPTPKSLPTKEKEKKKSDDFMKPVATQTPSDILRSISFNTLKRPTSALVSTGRVSRPTSESQKSIPGVSASRITEKKSYKTQSSENLTDQPKPISQKRNEKSQIVTQAAILQATRKQQIADQSSTIDMTKELQLTDVEISRLHQLIFEQMKKLSIHFPNKTDRETTRICNEILENWPEFKADIAHFWLAELDTDTRPSIIEIVWKNISQIMLEICIMENLVEYLPLNRNFIKLKRRLLSNHGQPFWDACQDRHNSWESLFVKSTKPISVLELDCCYRFVDLCKQALFIVYQYSRQQQGLPTKYQNSI